MKPPGNENFASLEEQNALKVKVVELCGWKYGNLAGVTLPIVKGYSNTGWFEPDGKHHDTAPPDYPNDLNACAKFEKWLTRDQQYKYALILLRLPEIGYGGTEPMSCCFPVISATAEQRCRAFVAVMERKVK